MGVVGKLVLALLSLGYEVAVRFRNYLYDKRICSTYKSPLTVVSVGNVTAGGNAKTPLCRFIAGELALRGFRPVVLSRGYGGKLKGPHLVNVDDECADVGDEPLMLTLLSGLKVVVARDRVKGAKFIEENGIGDIIILDDGFQHRRLSRSVDIVSVNVGDGRGVEDFLDGFLLPLGRFREPRGVALKRADMVVFAERRLAGENREIDSRLFKVISSRVQLYRSYIESCEVKAAVAGRPPLALTNTAAFCGIAHPEGFFATLRALGFNLVGTRSFRDHFVFAQDDLAELHRLYPGQPLICTAKDYVKIRSFPEHLLEWVYYLDVKTTVAPGDAFIVQLLKTAKGRGAEKVIENISGWKR